MVVKHSTIHIPNDIVASADWNANHIIDPNTITAAQTQFADQDVKIASSPRFAKLEIDDANTHLDKDVGNNLVLTDIVTGSKTLAQLAAAAAPNGIISLTPGAGVYPTTNPALLYKVDGTNLSYDEARFDDTTAEEVYFSFVVPDGYDGGNVVFQIIWKSAVIVGDVVWVTGDRSVADSDAWDAALADTAWAASTTDGTAEDVNVTEKTYDPGWTAGELVQFRVKRTPADGGDTLIGDAKLLAVKIKFTYS